MTESEPNSVKYVTRTQLISVCSLTGVLAVIAAYGLSRVDIFRIERTLDRIEAKVSHGVMSQIVGVNTADEEFNKNTREVLKKQGSIP